MKQMGSSCDVLAAYLCDTHDSAGTVAFIRDKWPRSLSSYLSAVKKQWLTLGEEHETLPAQFHAAFAEVDAAIARETSKVRKATLRAAREKLAQFRDMSLSNKYALQRTLRSAPVPSRTTAG